MNTFKSCFAKRLDDYVKLRRGLGLKFDMQSAILRMFDRYVHERKYNGALTQKLALDFASANIDVMPNAVSRRYNVVRHFSEYLAIFEPDTPRLDPGALPFRRIRPPAYIYTQEELARLLDEARRISPKSPIRGITLYVMVGLAASTGLRVSEVVRLDKNDVNLETGVMSIRQTKFFKDRLVPVHQTTRDVLCEYAAIRDTVYAGCDCPAFFINMSRTRFSPHTLQLSFWDLTRRVGLRGDRGRGPRFHDLRHSFTVRRIVEWYRAGENVQSLLPSLATYMGHVLYSETAYYITATAELLGLAADRYHTWLQGREVQS